MPSTIATRGNRPQSRNMRLKWSPVRCRCLPSVQAMALPVSALVMARLLKVMSLALTCLSAAVYSSSADPLLFEGLTTVMILLGVMLSETECSIRASLKDPSMLCTEKMGVRLFVRPRAATVCLQLRQQLSPPLMVFSVSLMTKPNI